MLISKKRLVRHSLRSGVTILSFLLSGINFGRTHEIKSNPLRIKKRGTFHAKKTEKKNRYLYKKKRLHCLLIP